jgi:Uma2 family endonuclease
MSTTVAAETQIASQPELPGGSAITPERLLRMPDGKNYELIDGELVERKMSVLSGVVASRTNRLLGNYCEERNLGWVMDSEVGYQCFPWKPDRVRRADVSFIAGQRYSLDQLSREGYSSVPPDLVVEVISPKDLAKELDEKLEDYLRARVKLIWVINPETRTLQVYYPDGTSRRLHEADDVSGDDVIPGFRCSVATLFPAAPEDRSATTVSPSA